MDQFEYFSAFFSIVFGLALTHVLAGAFQTLQRRRVSTLQLTYAAFLILAIVLNWWNSFSWRDFSGWTFERFLLVVVWTVLYYALAITLFPEAEDTAGAFAENRRTFLAVLLALFVVDIAVTSFQTGLFSPWYYLPFVGHYILLTGLAIVIRAPAFQLGAAIWFCGSLLVWSLVVRRFVQ